MKLTPKMVIMNKIEYFMNRKIIMYGIFALVAVFAFLIAACDDTTSCTHDSGAWHTTLEPTCTADGTKELRCTKCGSVLQTQTIDAECNCTTCDCVTCECDCANCDNGGDELVYSISLSQSGTHTFASRSQGYTIPPVLTVTVTNTGNQHTGELTVYYLFAGGTSFTVSSETLASIAPSETATFSVSPRTGLAINSYSATLRVNNNGNSFGAQFTLSFSVTAPVPTLFWGTYWPPESRIDDGHFESFNLEYLTRLLNGEVTTSIRHDSSSWGMIYQEDWLAPGIGMVNNVQVREIIKENQSVSFNDLGYLFIATPKEFGTVTITQAGISVMGQYTHYDTVIDNVPYNLYIFIVQQNIFTAAHIIEFSTTLVQHTVTWHLSGGAWAGTPPATSITNGGTLSAPEAPTKTNAAFQGWFTNAALTTSITLPTTVTENLTLYAKWQWNHPLLFWGTYWPPESLVDDGQFAPLDLEYLTRLLNGEVTTSIRHDASSWGMIYQEDWLAPGIGILNIQGNVIFANQSSVSTTENGYHLIVTPHRLSDITVGGFTMFNSFTEVPVTIDGNNYFVYYAGPYSAATLNMVLVYQQITPYWNITWHLSGGAWPTGSPSVTQVEKGSVLSYPEYNNYPTKRNSTWDWLFYLDPECTNRFVFDHETNPTIVTTDITLYVKWTQINPELYWGTYIPKPVNFQASNWAMENFDINELIHTIEIARRVTGANLILLPDDTVPVGPPVVWTEFKNWQSFTNQTAITTTGAGYHYIVTPNKLNDITMLGVTSFNQFTETQVIIDGNNYFVYYAGPYSAATLNMVLVYQ